MAKKIQVPITIEALDGDGFHIFTEVRMEKHTVRALIDTGASKTVLDKAFAAGLRKAGPAENMESQAKGIGEEMLDTAILILPKLRLGKLKIEQLTVGVLDLGHIAAAYQTLHIRPFQMIIGGDILREYEATISYGRKRLSLRSKK